MVNDHLYSSEPVLANMWLLKSGIQNAGGPGKGGFNSWFDLARKDYSYIYSEITGYGITSLLYLSRYFGEEFYLDKAVSAYEWLATSALDDSGGVRTRDYYHDMENSGRYSFDSGNIYAFDNGMVLYGVVNLYKRTGDSRHLAFARTLADFLVKNMVKDDGSFYAVYNSLTGEKTDKPGKWSTQTGSYHAKLALGFGDLFGVTGDLQYERVVKDLLRHSLRYQEASGRFVTDRADNSTHLHPHLYSAEGLLYAGISSGEKDFVSSAAKAVKWALDSAREDGGVPKKFDGKDFSPFYRSDILAQALRLGSWLYGLDMLGEEYAPALKKLRRKLVSFQYRGSGSQDGGFYYGYGLDGAKKEHLNSWCTMFAVQALMMYDENVVKRSGKTVECFV